MRNRLPAFVAVRQPSHDPPDDARRKQHADVAVRDAPDFGTPRMGKFVDGLHRGKEIELGRDDQGLSGRGRRGVFDQIE